MRMDDPLKLDEAVTGPLRPDVLLVEGFPETLKTHHFLELFQPIVDAASSSAEDETPTRVSLYWRTNNSL